MTDPNGTSGASGAPGAHGTGRPSGPDGPPDPRSDPMADPPYGYRSREDIHLRHGSPPRDMTQFHVQRSDMDRFAIWRIRSSRGGRVVPLWKAFETLLNLSPEVAAAVEAEEKERGRA